MGLESGNYIDDLVVSNPVGSTDSKSQGDDHLRLIKTVLKNTFPDLTRPVYLDHAQADVVSATTCNIGAATTNFVRITGTTTITGFDSVGAGIWRMLRFAAALTLTYNATSLILPGAANITTAAGDTAIAVSLGSGNWLVVDYTRASGKAIIPPTAEEVPVTAAGNIESTDVQNALEELDTKKAVAAVGQGQHTLYIPAGALIANETNGPGRGLLETSTNDVMVMYLAFDASTPEYAQYAFQMPKSWDGGTLIAQPVWFHRSGGSAFNVVWGVRAVALTDADALDSAFGSAAEVTDSGGTADLIYISSETGEITVSGDPTGEAWVVIQIYRAAGSVSDTLDIDALLVGLRVHYTTDAATDD